jgi:hypothetical protein
MAEDPRAGVQTGPNRTAFVFIVDVKPGHEKELREYFETNQGSPGVAVGLEEIGTLHEFRWVLFDDDRRLLFASSFDGRFDTYIQDFASGSIGVLIDTALQHCVGWPGIADPGATEWFLQHAPKPAAAASAYPEPSVKEVWKALALQEAFEHLLDNGGAEALQNPALKPLLEHAAD